MSDPKADQRSATQIRTEAIVAAALATSSARAKGRSPTPDRFLRPRVVTAPTLVQTG